MAIDVAVKDRAGKEIGRMDLHEAVFGVPMNAAVVHQALVRQRANARQGTASTKTRGEVSGTTRKPWRQKHTGRARVGTARNPIWRHGGVAFGPKPRDYSQQMPRKMRRLAIRCLLTSKRERGTLEVLKDLALEEGKTKEITQLLEALDIRGTVLLVTAGSDGKVSRSARNLATVKSLPADLLNAGDLLKYHYLIMTVEAVRLAESIWVGTKISRKRYPGETVEAPEPLPVGLDEWLAEEEPKSEAKPKRVPRTRTGRSSATKGVPAESEGVTHAEVAPKPESVAETATEAKSQPSKENPKPRRRATGTGPSSRRRSTRKKPDA